MEYGIGLLEDLRGKIDRAIPTPIYYQLKLLIKEKIDGGLLNNGDMLPTEESLSAALGISRPTVRQGMQELVTEGYLSRQKGKGTFVTRQKIEVNYVAKHERFYETVRKNGFVPSARVLEFGVVPAVPQVNEILQIGADEELYVLRRLFLGNDSPMMFSVSYTQASRFPGLLQYEFTKQSLYATLRDVYRTPVAGIRREVGCANADRAEAELLGVSKGRAIFIVDNLGLDAAGRPVEYSVSYYRSEVIKFTHYMKY
ncbi:MAG TPA: GntR family transcriptional regulator [Candidatus Limnocylindria bacterium]|nr:GntR family transcriptional regulator [Candidatus Limnocylindria bacterium]